eukprot:CAMPEP_0118688586 /NCGR_PEP_ID=MMETSP0800-20121206/9005_1 /TAXON_ID=210618 ORGANISM="Striatella unipunctata, Strain CCMP2910" /NCGR_SAMPLE_ID=MMETSP0800 /ASSEMBLY_ACC=CAM_ASM_000638 /LENGTH=291 /DNA_ID=CAMNT_0006585867 /DNA_START=20 /DNA_END=895 /DNA_ORIENTATION=+
MTEQQGPLIGVLALQGAFEEHQQHLEAIGCQTRQVRTPQQLEGLDAIVLPGGESTAMGLIGTSGGDNMWTALKDFSQHKPTWGTCAGMILLAERCVGTSAVIEKGQALIGGMDILVCRNYFGSQISSFELSTPAPPGWEDGGSFPGVFIRAPAILTAQEKDQVLGRVVATPCRQAAVVLKELERKLEMGENVISMEVVDALQRKSDKTAGGGGGGGGLDYIEVVKEKGTMEAAAKEDVIELPGAANGSNAREVICAVRKGNLLCTAFHPELTTDLRWHEYFAKMVKERKGE